ncbi:hypothetical protein N9A94_09345, partial [Akkermansiaceae bacterium]|nr:hypothetical protein [Akkermansiaceae bacterium]
SPGGSDAVTFVGNPDADADRDGQSAFFEFVLGSSDNDLRPAAPPVVSVDSQGYFIFEFRYNLAADGTIITIEGADGLSEWQDISAELIRFSTTNHGDGTATTRFRSLFPVLGLSDSYFLRLKVGK